MTPRRRIVSTPAEEAAAIARAARDGQQAKEQALVTVLSEIIKKMPPLSDETRQRIAELMDGGDVHVT